MEPVHTHPVHKEFRHTNLSTEAEGSWPPSQTSMHRLYMYAQTVHVQRANVRCACAELCSVCWQQQAESCLRASSMWHVARSM